MAFQKGHPKLGGKKKGTPNRTTVVKREAEARALRQIDITAERTMLEVARMAFADRRGIWQDGRLKPLEEWTADQAALLEGLEVVIKNAQAGDGHTDTVHKVKLSQKLGALEILAKHFGLYEERLRHSGGIAITHELGDD